MLGPPGIKVSVVGGVCADVDGSKEQKDATARKRREDVIAAGQRSSITLWNYWSSEIAQIPISKTTLLFFSQMLLFFYTCNYFRWVMPPK